MSLSVTSRGRGVYAIFKHRASGSRGHIPHPCCWRLAAPCLTDSPRAAAHTGGGAGGRRWHSTEACSKGSYVVVKACRWWEGRVSQTGPRAVVTAHCGLRDCQNLVNQDVQARPRLLRRHRGPTGWDEHCKTRGKNLALKNFKTPRFWRIVCGEGVDLSLPDQVPRTPQGSEVWSQHAVKAYLLIQYHSKGLCCLLNVKRPSHIVTSDGGQEGTKLTVVSLEYASKNQVRCQELLAQKSHISAWEKKICSVRLSEWPSDWAIDFGALSAFLLTSLDTPP